MTSPTPVRPSGAVAFFGMGNMGLPMAKNLAGAFDVRVFDPQGDARDRAAENGLAVSAPEAFDPQAEWDAVFTMLPDAQSVETLLLGENNDGLLFRAKAQTLFADCSTTGPDSARRVAEVARAQEVAFVDAPVSGGVSGATAAKLSFIVGGDEAHLNRVRPCLEKMGAAVFHAGPAGAGQAAKMCNNMLLSVLMIGTCEALALGEANGLNPATLSEIMRKSSGGNWALEVYNPWPGVMKNAPASRDYAGGFLVDLMVKDCDLAAESAKKTKSFTALGEMARHLFTAQQKAGFGQRDFSSILNLVRYKAKAKSSGEGSESSGKGSESSGGSSEGSGEGSESSGKGSESSGGSSEGSGEGSESSGGSSESSGEKS